MNERSPILPIYGKIYDEGARSIPRRSVSYEPLQEDKADFVCACLAMTPAIIITLFIIWCYVISKMSAHRLGIFFVTAYGCVAIINYAVQFVLALAERRRIDSVPRGTHELSVCVQVAGWKEDEHYFKDCLRSITDVKYENVKRAIVVVDGCEEDDEYMGNCCEEVFGSRVRVVHLPKLLDPDDEEQNEKLFKEYVDPYDNYPVLAILQPHHSKRSAIYTAVRISIRKKYDLQFNTDSDTIIKPDCIGYLVDVVESRPDAGAVAGSLEIFNAGESLLARLSHARYYMAFQIERCAQSFFGCVDCISGPCGIYRTDVLRRIIDGWYTQEFMGKRTTSGDDRHLSNRVLSTGRRIYFSHLAACRTETPTTLGRWMKQQCRWMRSAIREAGYELFYVIHKQSLFLSWTLSFYQLYAFALVITLVLLFYRDHTVLSVCSIFIASMVIPTVRSVFVYIFMDRKRPDVFLMALYGPLFILTLIPIKFYAIATLGETSWFTSARKSTLFSNKCDMLYVWVLGWIVFLIVGAFLKVVS